MKLTNFVKSKTGEAIQDLFDRCYFNLAKWDPVVLEYKTTQQEILLREWTVTAFKEHLSCSYGDDWRRMLEIADEEYSKQQKEGPCCPEPDIHETWCWKCGKQVKSEPKVAEMK